MSSLLRVDKTREEARTEASDDETSSTPRGSVVESERRLRVSGTEMICIAKTDVLLDLTALPFHSVCDGGSNPGDFVRPVTFTSHIKRDNLYKDRYHGISGVTTDGE